MAEAKRTKRPRKTTKSGNSWKKSDYDDFEGRVSWSSFGDGKSSKKGKK